MQLLGIGKANKHKQSWLRQAIVASLLGVTSGQALSGEPDDNGVVNSQFNRIYTYNLGSGQCEGTLNNLADVNLDDAPDDTIEASKIRLSARPNWNCDEYFADKFAGDIYIPNEEEITFYLSSSDGSALYINGTKLIDNDGIHGVQEVSNSLTLSEGWHYLEVHYFNSDGGQSLTLSYSSTTLGAQQEVPTSALRLNGGLDNDNDGVNNYHDTDDDNDGVLDVNDAFPFDSTESSDNDSDGLGDNADNDDDNDGVEDDDDAFPFDASESVDTDNDGIGNNADTDDDNDGVLDTNDLFPLDATESADNDGDGVGDNADTDDDNDGVEDNADAFPFDATETTDTDGDGIGNNADTDDDNDGVLDTNDLFPLDATESADNDGDGVGDNADTDDDNDSLPDSYEINHGLDPLMDDTESDFDSDRINNIDEFSTNTSPSDATDYRAEFIDRWQQLGQATWDFLGDDQFFK